MSDDCSRRIHEKQRVFVYIDAFNVFYGLRHACMDADRSLLKYGGKPGECIGRSLYWLDLESVIRSMLKRSEICLAMKYFTAPRKVPKLVADVHPDRYIRSNDRQSVYLDALATKELIEIHLGWYSENQPHTCAQCGHQWVNFEEKVTDVNIATHMLCDAYEDRYDIAFVISADADLVPPVEAVRKIGKAVIIGLFPGRKQAAHLRRVASEERGIKIRSIRDKRFPDIIHRDGLPPLECPKHWMPPGEWVWRTPAPLPHANKSSPHDGAR